jgi:hypothetical protein
MLLNGTTSDDKVDSSADNGFFSKIASSMKGQNVVFPKMWQDSTFSRSYSLAFRFETPYGDSLSIWRHVYVPFLILFTMAMPRQTGALAYVAPFIVRVDCPGWFTIDTGIITNISIKKGEAGWSAAGLPLSIDVNIEVEDIYPQLMVANNVAVLNLNFSLAAYLDSMTGISFVESLTGGTLMHGIRGMLTRWISAPRAKFNSIANKFIGTVQGINNRLGNFIQ